MSDNDLVQQCIAELLDIVRCRCHPAYRDRGMQDPDCECDSGHAVQVVADRIEELETKLAKAAEALDEAWFMLTVPHLNYEPEPEEPGLRRIKTTLAELKREDRG